MRTIANALDAIAADQHYTFAADTYDLANLFRAELRDNLNTMEEHITEIEGEELSALKDELLAIGFSTRTISKAFKTLARKDA
jgi:arginine deiminase